MIVEPFDLAFARTPADVLHPRVRARADPPARGLRGLRLPLRPRSRGLDAAAHGARPAPGLLRDDHSRSGDRARATSTRRASASCSGEAAVEEAAALLGREYSVRGRVGKRRGARAHARLSDRESRARERGAAGASASTRAGCAASTTASPPAGAMLPAVTNVGTRPTFGASDRVVVEAHLIDFSGDLYGRRVELSFRFHLRPERRFAGVERAARADRDRSRGGAPAPGEPDERVDPRRRPPPLARCATGASGSGSR